MCLPVIYVTVCALEYQSYCHKNPFLPLHKSYTHALFRVRDTNLRLDGLICLYRWLFSNAVKPQWCILWPVWPLCSISNTAWGTKLILTAGLAYLTLPCEYIVSV